MERPQPTDRPEPGDGTRALASRARADGIEVLERTVTRLRRETDGLRRALRYRAVIEQAKGILVVRLGVGPDAAFRWLVERSQQDNRKLTTVAAGVVAHALSASEHRGDVADQAPAGDVRVQLAAAAFAVAPGACELTEAVVDELADLEVTGAALFAVDTGDALGLLAAHGLTTAVKGWHRIALTADVPVAAAARTGQPVLVTDQADRLAHFPGTRHIPDLPGAIAALPLTDGNRVIGVLALVWPTTFAFDEATIDRLIATTERTVPRLLGLLERWPDDLVELHVDPGYDDWFHRFLGSLPIPVALLEPRREDGHVVDLIVVHTNDASDAGLGPVGRSVLERFPQLVRTELFDEVRRVLETGAPWSTPQFILPTSVDGPGVVVDDLTVTRLGNLVAMSGRAVHRAQGDRSKR
ncbi:GAF and ANTAR domain-containing protein [Nitriliruptor alkaliphilus]|uniref:GAF and ANTAR domain-containing protein n=1 Tax=Nitriliruptor alkaliphilus TaxID=427918 RepID=UPI00069868FA|nr:ANTAR domain-containing protein [Nitriliruptor alkaliphilus]